MKDKKKPLDRKEERLFVSPFQLPSRHNLRVYNNSDNNRDGDDAEYERYPFHL